MDKSVVLIRYADDFLVTAPSKEVGVAPIDVEEEEAALPALSR